MFDNGNFVALEIKNKIRSHFIDADINIVFDKEQNEYFVSTQNRELYYSEEYGKLVLEISQSLLWGQGIFNFYFVLDSSGREFDKTVKEILFSLKREVTYTAWNVNASSALFVDKHVDVNDSSMAA